MDAQQMDKQPGLRIHPPLKAMRQETSIPLGIDSARLVAATEEQGNCLCCFCRESAVPDASMQASEPVCCPLQMKEDQASEFIRSLRPESES